MDTFGEWLRQQRNQRKLTREQFADRVGCSISLLRKIEEGERRPSAQIAGLMANSLNILPAEHATFIKVARGELSVDRLPAAMRPVAASRIPRSNLPVNPTPLIGRQREVAELNQLLCNPQCRLLTLVGPGGIGKTRLAIETASQVQDAFNDSVFFVPLAPVNTTRLMVPVIADAIGFTFASSSQADPKTQLFDYLQQKQVLLLTDNLEQLLAEPGIELLAELLASAPQVKLLVTSRESLRLQGEWIYEVKGLPVPQGVYAEESTQDTSVELFLQRARRAHVGFNVTEADYPAILRICQLVEGMPLGIELAAAWVRMLSCDEIAQEIQRGLDFLRGSARDLPPRHRSMRAVFDHSWKLLPEEEQGVLLRLSVFQGGFRREAAEVVAGATLPVLSMLVTKSFVHRSGTGRFDLHELIHQFAAERFAERAEERAVAQSIHSYYYLTFFSQADGRLRSSALPEAIADLTAEMDNFRSAWAWAVTHREFALIEQVIRAFSIFCDIRGWLQEGIDMLGSAINALETAPGQLSPERIHQVTLGHILSMRSSIASRMGQYEMAHAWLERSVEILRPLDEPRVLVEAVTFLGMVMEFTGDYVRAAELYTEGLDIATAIGDRWFAALCSLCFIGLVGINQTIITPEKTHERLRSVVADWRTIGDPRLTAIALNVFSWNAMALGRYEEARSGLEESVRLGKTIGDRWGLGFAYRGLALITQRLGEHQQAVELFRESLDLLTELGARQDVARLFAEMSRSLFALGNDEEAGHLWREALRIAMDNRGMFIALEALVGMASLQAKRGNREFALELLLTAMNHPAVLQETRDRAEPLRIELEARLTKPQVEAAQARALAMTFEDIVNQVLR